MGARQFVTVAVHAVSAWGLGQSQYCIIGPRYVALVAPMIVHEADGALALLEHLRSELSSTLAQVRSLVDAEKAVMESVGRVIQSPENADRGPPLHRPLSGIAILVAVSSSASLNNHRFHLVQDSNMPCLRLNTRGVQCLFEPDAFPSSFGQRGTFVEGERLLPIRGVDIELSNGEWLVFLPGPHWRFARSLRYTGSLVELDRQMVELSQPHIGFHRREGWIGLQATLHTIS
jgi:hypothetical protein